MYSKIALKLYALKKEQTIKSNAHFWREFNNLDKINDFDVDVQKYEQELKNKAISLVCSFDDEFPKSPTNLKVSEKPFLFAFKGDIKLLENITKNVAIVGVLTPTPDIIERERKIVERLVQKEFCIISGLAKGCDTVAHKESLLNGGKTIAILPSNLENI